MCIIGDFNDILSCNEKKKGRIDRPNWLISGFRQAAQDVGLIVIPLEGYPFTWFKSLGIASVSKKLDRARHHVSDRNFNYFSSLKNWLTSLLVKDGLFWRQRAKAHRYKDGDLNTHFFHVSATLRKKINTIKSLANENGEVTNSTK